MKNLKISQKLLVGFGTVLLMLLIAAAVSFFNMNTINAQVEQYVTYTVPNNKGSLANAPRHDFRTALCTYGFI